MPSSTVDWAINDSVATLTFARPHARNALTWDMYDALVEACERVDESSTLRVLVIRGAGGTFASGTDISQFREFASGDDGIAYERRLEAVIDRVERVTRLTVAAVDGPAVGGGCAIALACDLRICTPRARFGVPVARTLGNCLSAANLARLIDAVGLPRAQEMLFSARLLEAEEAAAIGLARLVSQERFDAEVDALAIELTARATSTIVASKALLQQRRSARRPEAANDIIAACYASDEFREGVQAFCERRDPPWAAAAAKPPERP